MALALYDAQTAELLVASPHYLQLVQLASNDRTVSGGRWHELSPLAAGAEASKLWDQAMQSGAPLRLAEVRVSSGADQRETIWNLTLTPIDGTEQIGTRRFVLVSAVEVTEQVRAREELLRLDRLKDEFLSLASHELRTPLTPLMGYADLMGRLLAQPGGLDSGLQQRMTRTVEKFSAQLKYMNRLIDDLVDISRLETGKFTLKQEPVNLGALLEQAMEETQMASSGPTIRLHLPDGDPPLLVWGDSARLLQVVLNLLRNALTYAPHSSHIDVRLSYACAAGDAARDMIQLAVQDYGPGIAPQDQAAIFTRFYQVARDDRQARSGLGLGLFICKQIVEQHGGTITVESVVGEGSTFIVNLPRFQPKT